MARMIPPVIDPDTKSDGEKEIFQRLKNDSSTGDWIVLHSLNVAHHLTQIEGEIDFVVIIPGVGVLCVEVKAHRHVRCLDGHWLFGKYEKPDKSPFRQASDAMRSIKADVVKQGSGLEHVPFWSCVVFPYVELSVESREWHPWQLLDARAFRTRPIGVLFLGVMENARRYLTLSKGATWFIPDRPDPTPSQCALIAQTLRPIFEVFESPRARRQQDEAIMLELTQEQFEALDAMEDNPRVIFTGPAGTGKSLLAIEAAQRAHERGQRILLACYNELLGRWLKEQVSPLENVVAGTLHSHMLRVAGIEVDTGNAEFWEEVLPERATDRLLEVSHPEFLFDVIIIDEAQDLLRNSYLDFLDMSLSGGLAGGTLRLFGDFEKQAIYGAAVLSLGDFRRERCMDAAVHGLRTNCRNTPRVAALVRLLCELDPDYKRIRRPDNETEPRILYYHDSVDQRRLLVDALESLHAERFDWSEIVVLSPRRDDLSVATSLGPPWSQRLRPYRMSQTGSIGYTSIQAFKGLEAPAVVVTDIDDVDSDRMRALFYIALSRAVHRLVVLISDAARPEVLKHVMRRSDAGSFKAGV